MMQAHLQGLPFSQYMSIYAATNTFRKTLKDYYWCLKCVDALASTPTGIITPSLFVSTGLPLKFHTFKAPVAKCK
jgi:hypothetical protein